MPHALSTPPPTPADADRPKAVGFLRTELAGLDAPRQTTALRRHAEALGYRYLYTVRPPERADDPVGYVLNFVAGMQLSAVIVFDLETVDHSPARICEACDLETVVPPETWARTRSSDPDSHDFPEGGLSVGEAVRIMQLHRDCVRLNCPRKSTAFGRLVAAGKLTPAATTAEDRARERGLPVPESGAPAPLARTA
ncbi:hypothetical protein [Nocardia wallacei]|uniref:hypothetical protein n=1 Tax=Nocardia wallacei TaxID=480035 RepID=UPI002456D2F3|nr:hypothetical protein [Nocardia wallacei]